MRSKLFVLVLVGCVCGMGCDDGREKVEHPGGDEAWEIAHAEAVDEQMVVARVGDVPITVEDIELAWREEPELEAQQIVDQLVEREILAQEARRLGYHERPEVSFSRKQGMVSALLAAEVEKEAQPDTEGRDEEIEAVANERRIPAGLRASHLVILVPEEIEGERIDSELREEKFERARGWIDEAAQQLGEEIDDDDLRDMAAKLNEKVLAEPFEAVVNEHLRFPRADESYRPGRLPSGWVSVLSEFAQGAEAVADAEVRGQLSEPVRTRLGWHLIRVLDVMEAREADREAVEAYVDRRFVIEAKDAKLREKMMEWAEGASVELFPERLGSVFDE